MATNTNATGIFAQVYDFLFGPRSGPEPEPRRILCTGKWREFEQRRILLETTLKTPVTALSHEDEGTLQAQCAHKIMVENGFVKSFAEDMEAVYLYLGAGRGSSQFTLLDATGEFVNAYNVSTGYPKGGEPDIDLLKKTAGEIHDTFGDSIRMIVGFDSIYHVLKKTCPVVPDEGILADFQMTKGKDFAALGYLTELYPDTDMLVVRNFVTSDGNMRKITFATGTELLIDLGSGNANLVNPLTGQQLETRELPADWMTNDLSLVEVSESLTDLLELADKYDEETDSEEATDSEYEESEQEQVEQEEEAH